MTRFSRVKRARNVKSIISLILRWTQSLHPILQADESNGLYPTGNSSLRRNTLLSMALVPVHDLVLPSEIIHHHHPVFCRKRTMTGLCQRHHPGIGLLLLQKRHRVLQRLYVRRVPLQHLREVEMSRASLQPPHRRDRPRTESRQSFPC